MTEAGREAVWKEFEDWLNSLNTFNRCHSDFSSFLAGRKSGMEAAAKIADEEAAVPREEGGNLSRTDACMNVAVAIRRSAGEGE